jgi:membrane protein implicated in regulation of membrane protease activity
MDPALIWAITGLGLVVVELAAGTFYLLILGVAAFAAAGTAWLGYALPVQAIVACVIAAVGCYAVHLHRVR